MSDFLQQHKKVLDKLKSQEETKLIKLEIQNTLNNVAKDYEIYYRLCCTPTITLELNIQQGFFIKNILKLSYEGIETEIDFSSISKELSEISESIKSTLLCDNIVRQINNFFKDKDVK